VLKKSKWLFYFKHILLMSTNNKIRLTLTSIGVFVAVFLFSAGTIVTNSYYSGLTKVVLEIKDNTVVVTSSHDPVIVKNEISKITNVISIEELLLSQKKTILSVPINQEQYLNVFARVHGVSSMNSLVPIVTDNNTMLPVNTQLVRGRTISQLDVQSSALVVVIDELTEKLLFPYGDSLGQSITLSVGSNGIAVGGSDFISNNLMVEVIGVVKNSFVSETRELMLRRELNKSSDNINVETSVYIPITTLNTHYDEDKTRYYIYTFEQSRDYEEFTARMTSVINVNATRGITYNFTNKDIRLDELRKELSEIKLIISVATFLLCVISGISIMSIIFFSVKERIPEIGVRKAFGASKLDIAFQFVFEMVIIAFIVSVIAVCTSFFVCKLMESYLTTHLYMSFIVSVPLTQLALPVFVGVIQVIICCIIPSLYAANIKVTDSLKFE